MHRPVNSLTGSNTTTFEDVARLVPWAIAFVTFDVATIPMLLQDLAETGREHARVLLVSTRSFSPADVGALARAIDHACTVHDDLRGRVLFLTRS